jgi:hypothetical protein
VQKALQLEREPAQDVADMFGGQNGDLPRFTVEAAATGEQSFAQGNAACRRDDQWRV